MAVPVPILLFHRVHPGRDPLWDPMNPELFKEVIHYLSRKYTILALEDYFFRERRKYNKPPAIITFDDGYHDFLDYSFPVLQQYNMPATLFVVTECIDENKPTWTYELDHLFYNTSRLETPVPPQLKKFRMLNSWKDAEERLLFAGKLKQHLKKVPSAERNGVVLFYKTVLDDVKHEKQAMLSWDELRFLKSKGIEIGSHTVSHPPLATLEDEAMIEYELFQSGMRIKQELGSFPAAISYPVGSYNSKVKHLAHKCGYKIGLAVDQAIYNEEVHGRFSVPRIELYNESFFKTRLRIGGTISRIKRITRFNS